MPRKRAVRKHEVRAYVQIPELSKNGSSMYFEVFADGEKLGTLLVGRGSLTWYKRKGKSGNDMSWTEFARLMEGE